MFSRAIFIENEWLQYESIIPDPFSIKLHCKNRLVIDSDHKTIKIHNKT